MMKTRSTSRFRRSFRVGLLALLLAVPAGIATAQQISVLTIELERLFAETGLGAESRARLEQRAREIQAENARIERDLIAEEQALTEQRASLPTEEFRALADAFHARVEQLRAEQDEKERQFNRQQSEAQAAFFEDIRSLLAEIMVEKGASVVLERRDVFLSADWIDITDEAIARINAAPRDPN